MLRSTNAPFSRLFTTCHSAESEIRGWGNIMANGDSAHTRTRAGFCPTALSLTLVACATRPTTGIGSSGTLSFHRNQGAPAAPARKGGNNPAIGGAYRPHASPRKFTFSEISAIE